MKDRYLTPEDHPAPVPLTLVHPQDEDLVEGRVSLLGALGLPIIGQVIGSQVILPQGVARFIGFDRAQGRP